MTDNEIPKDVDVHWQKHYPKWYDKFFSPAGVMILFGAIVWGIQLNFATLQNTESIGELRASQEDGIKLLYEATIKLERTAATLDSLEKRIVGLEGK